MNKKKILRTAFRFLPLLLVFYCNNIKAQTAKKSNSVSGWKQLFNGKNLDGWKHVGKGNSILEDGMIHGQGGMGLLYYSKEICYFIS